MLLMGYEIHLGDCLEILPTLPDASVDCVITDPPYNVGFDYDGGVDDRKKNYSDWCKAWFSELRRICKGPIAISVGQANLSTWAIIAPPDWWIAWWKPAAMGRCVVGFNNWEPIALYGKPKRAGCDVIRATIKPDKSIGWHPCPKPLEWATKQVELLTGPGAMVLDPFLGSGTTGTACIKAGRNFIGIEKMPTYYDMARKRLESATLPLLAGV
jgi:DNA modification methylase